MIPRMTRSAALRLARAALRAQMKRLAFEHNLYRYYRVPYAKKSAELYQRHQQALACLESLLIEDKKPAPKGHRAARRRLKGKT